MLSPFEVYTVFQLDSLKAGLHGLIWIFSISTLVFLAIYFENLDKGPSYENVAKAAKNILLASFVSLSLAVPAQIFIPSSKTAAAMVVLPAVANSGHLQLAGDVGVEVLKLAKKGLQSLVEDG